MTRNPIPIRINGESFTIKAAATRYPALSRNFLEGVDRGREWTLAELMAENELRRAIGRRHAVSPASRKSINGLVRFQVRKPA